MPRNSIALRSLRRQLWYRRRSRVMQLTAVSQLVSIHVVGNYECLGYSTLAISPARPIADVLLPEILGITGEMGAGPVDARTTTPGSMKISATYSPCPSI